MGGTFASLHGVNEFVHPLRVGRATKQLLHGTPQLGLPLVMRGEWLPDAIEVGCTGDVLAPGPHHRLSIEGVAIKKVGNGASTHSIGGLTKGLAIGGQDLIDRPGQRTSGPSTKPAVLAEDAAEQSSRKDVVDIGDNPVERGCLRIDTGRSENIGKFSVDPSLDAVARNNHEFAREG
ncbi:unannotated protein [freshwater metagenome]|uniref:Unannotated protein n=1 Tax=freshwater metagenome TaxID=449393 RepID=A0A6J6ARU8_9ZZZZ